MERVVDELVDILLAIADNEYQDIEFVDRINDNV